MGKRVALLLAFLVIFTGTVTYAAPETAPAGVDATADTDGDGMPDWWEVKYFGQGAKFNKFNGKMDLDGDKIGALDEYKMGTHPNNKKIDVNGDGVADDWMTFYGLKDINADADGDGASNKEEFDAGTDPKDAKSVPTEGNKISQVHPEPKLSGVRANLDKNIPDNHKIKEGVFKYNDPIGDDKGPGYYQYPTNPVYTAGSFDIVSFEVDASGKDNVVFKITVNADLKQNWGMAADFDVQHFQIYIDQDNVPGSGEVKSIPGLNVFFDPGNAWDKVVLITPQPQSRVQIEVDVKAKDQAENVVIPLKISGQGQTITAVVRKKDLGMGADDKIDGWAWQVVAQSNEGFPDPEDVLTRNVNEYRGLHRIGGGSDYWGDPELVDILVWPAMGSVQEAQDQFTILNIWESYPDPKLDVKAVLPLIKNDQTEQWMPKGGYTKYAKDLAAKIKPPAQRDKYVSDNFLLSTKVFTRWTWNLDPAKENFIKNSMEIQFFGKAFTDKVDYYMRWEIGWWDDTIWTQWENETPAQQPVVLQAFRGILVNPFPTVDTISIGNYEFDYNPWFMGAAWYPDRDKYKGIFVDGSVEGLFNYQLTMHYPLGWIGFDYSHGNNVVNDFVYGLKVTSASLVKNLNLGLVAGVYTDYEISPVVSAVNAPKKLIERGHNAGAIFDAQYKLGLGFADISLAATLGWAELKMGEDFKALEIAENNDIDGNGEIGSFGDSGINSDQETTGYIGVATVKVQNLLGVLNILGQGFYIDHNYQAIGAARGDTSALASGFGGSPTADVLEMKGNQSAHRAPQADDFTSSIPIPQLPNQFQLDDPVTSTAIGWINDNWEGIAAKGWQGGTVKAEFISSALRVDVEGSVITYNHPEYTNTVQIRALANVEYSLLKLNSKAVASLLFYNLSDGRIVEDTKLPTIISPKLTYSQQLGKFLSADLSYRLDFGTYTESGSLATVTTTMYYQRHRIGLSGRYSLPVGYITLKGEYWMEPIGGGNSFSSSRAPYGAYTITEWEFSF